MQRRTMHRSKLPTSGSVLTLELPHSLQTFRRCSAAIARRTVIPREIAWKLPKSNAQNGKRCRATTRQVAVAEDVDATRGRGDRGRGGGGNNGNKKDNKKGGSKYSTSGQFHRPKAGEDTREIIVNLCYPCSHCGWNQEHSTANHANGGGSGKKSTSNTPKKSDNRDFSKKAALAKLLAIQGITKAGIKDDDDDHDMPAVFYSLFSGIQKVLKE
eukprot:scaffold224920_cov33-Attheya_sp.AAC.3